MFDATFFNTVLLDLAALDFEILGNQASRWIAAGALALVATLALLTIKAIVSRRLRRAGESDPDGWEASTRTVLTRISTLFILVISLFAGVLLLDLPDAIRAAAFSATSIAVFVQAALIADRLVAIISARYAARHRATASNIENAMSLIRFLARCVVWSLASLMVLGNLGFDVTALVAGLGIGGIAIALAAQNVLGDLFASLAIVLDKPFVVGDFITFDDQAATVEKIGIKTTRLRSLSGEQLICANADLLSARVRNFKRMSERRISFQLGMVYETPHAKLERIPGILKEIIEGEELARFDRAHFSSYGDFSLNFAIVYYVLAPQYRVYMDVQQSINLNIFKRFETEGIEFAYPTRTVIVASGGVDAQTAAAAGS